MTAYSDFIHGLILAPRAVSAPTPSGPVLARAIAQEVGSDTRGTILELGPGTGVVTRALIEEGVAANRIIAIEYCEFFVRLLRQTMSMVTVHHGDAFQFEDYIPASTPVAAIVSGIPLLNFDLKIRRKLIRTAMQRSRHFIQLSYGWAPPVAPWAGVALKHRFIWRNLPPAHIWHYQNESSDGEAEC